MEDNTFEYQNASMIEKYQLILHHYRGKPNCAVLAHMMFSIFIIICLESVYVG